MEYCDRCGATGQARFVLASGKDLVFCGHHAREYKDGIEAVAQEDVMFSSIPVLVTV